MMANLMLSVSKLKVRFDNHTIIGNIDFDIVRDSTVAIIGPNGAGKSVLFRALLNLIKYEGEVRWDESARIGYVPQKLAVAKDVPLTVLEFLELKESDHKKINSALMSVGFKAKATHVHHDIRVLKTRLGSLSGGELQRIMMAYALLGNPNVLLLDEPTAGVDIAGEETFYDLFERLKKEKDLTIIFISHDQEVVNKYADKVIKLTHEH